MTVLIISEWNSVAWSSAVLQKAKQAQLGLQTLLWRCIVILKVYGCLVISSFFHPRNHKASESVGHTLTWWNMASISPITAVCFSQSQNNLFVKYEPRSTHKDVPSNIAAQSNTTWGFPGLLAFTTLCWGRYHVFQAIYQCPVLELYLHNLCSLDLQYHPCTSGEGMDPSGYIWKDCNLLTALCFLLGRSGQLYWDGMSML